MENTRKHITLWRCLRRWENARGRTLPRHNAATRTNKPAGRHSVEWRQINEVTLISELTRAGGRLGGGNPHRRGSLRSARPCEAKMKSGKASRNSRQRETAPRCGDSAHSAAPGPSTIRRRRSSSINARTRISVSGQTRPGRPLFLCPRSRSRRRPFFAASNPKR